MSENTKVISEISKVIAGRKLLVKI